uniref:Cytochrome c oxidase subunit 3 n=1 Tax=Chordodes sp. VVA-2019 TaxID=2586751 RepID=A0A514ABW6_9BILA|nr:cytochrome c oxidase subunit 3 [Chordodes sp. VVA-2019]
MMMNPYYLTKNSFLPLFTSLSLLSLAMMTLAMLWKIEMNTFLIPLILIIPFIYWFLELERETNYLGLMLNKENNFILFAFMLFILSEIMFFMSFFWSYFHFSFSPDIELGNSWPPMGIEPIPFFETPLLNTVVLLSSGVSITWAHHMFYYKKTKLNMIILVLMTIILGVYFSILQLEEYQSSSFSINDSCFGSNFFIATGFHGIHIIVGSMLLFSVFIKFLVGMNPTMYQTHFETAAWYWHFVDVVWLFLYLCIYWWGH